MEDVDGNDSNVDESVFGTPNSIRCSNHDNPSSSTPNCDSSSDAQPFFDLKPRSAQKIRNSVGSLGSEGRRLESEEFENISVSAIHELKAKPIDINVISVPDDHSVDVIGIHGDSVEQGHEFIGHPEGIHKPDDKSSCMHKENSHLKDFNPNLSCELKHDLNDIVEEQVEESIEPSSDDKSLNSMQTADGREVGVFGSLSVSFFKQIRILCMDFSYHITRC